MAATQDPGRNEAFLTALAELTRSVAGGWPTETLPYTLERLMDTLTDMPQEPADRQRVRELYAACSDSLVALDLGTVGVRHVGPAALPLVGSVLRTVREMRARIEVAKVMPPRPHGLPPVADSLQRHTDGR